MYGHRKFYPPSAIDSLLYSVISVLLVSLRLAANHLKESREKLQRFAIGAFGGHLILCCDGAQEVEFPFVVAGESLDFLVAIP